jgi:SAM-dependent methyltransferase
MAAVSGSAFWQDLYERRADGWEMGRAHPALAAWLAATPPPRGRVAVPGCGRGHDARLLAGHGYDVVGFDFAPAAVEAARALARLERVAVTFEQRDVFTLDRDHAHAFDGAWEYTCFCAIDPRRRAEYVRVLARIVRPGGWLLAVFFPVRRGAGGPPFPVSRAEVRRLLTPAFAIERAEAPARPAPRRVGLEWMVFARRTDRPG